MNKFPKKITVCSFFIYKFEKITTHHERISVAETIESG